MAQIPFSVSARAAQLIGRQNFSSAEGAILELVKNSYDADAKNCFVIFDIVYEAIPSKINFEDFVKIKSEFEKIDEFYNQEDESFILKSNFYENQELKSFFWSKNSIFIIDNGEGMSEDVIKNYWMTIGTGNKELSYLSAENRVKTGAKGIGRFALDRLGVFSEMWTKPKKQSGINEDKSYYWQMDWIQFEQSNKNISDVFAILDNDNKDLIDNYLELFKDNERIIDLLDTVKFVSGTIIKITGLKDIWDTAPLKAVFKSLEALIPPRDLDIDFNVLLYSLQDLSIFGKVETAYFNDYDYKVQAKYNSKEKIISFEIIRDELDISKVINEYSYLFLNQNYPFDLKTLQNKSFEDVKTVFEITKWVKDEKNEKLFTNVGDFSFTFYFLKMQASQKEDYPYKEINSAERRVVLDRFGGVKIYRDSFRVRPYGDKGNDWLYLGERAAQSPAGAGQRIGDWRIRPTQIAGLINISRIENKYLNDKSDRGGLIEDEVFHTLKKIVEGIIHYFEVDRTKVLNPFYLDGETKKEAKRKAEIQKEAQKMANMMIEKREAEIKARYETLNLDQKERIIRDKEQYQREFEKEFSKFQNDDNKDAEIAQVRNLASLGLIVASFAHELKSIRNNVSELELLEKIYNRLTPSNAISTLEYNDGFDIINLLKRDGEKIKHWVDYSLTVVKQDKRKRETLKFENYFTGLVKQWKEALKDRNIEIQIINNLSDTYEFRAFEMDMNTIFSNLISNSIDAFRNLKVSLEKRLILIEFSNRQNIIQILYSDNATGIPNVFSDKNDIFLPFITSKKDKAGNSIGMGLGMYLVKNVIQDNNGNIDILDRNVGFAVQINFPLRTK